MFPEGVDGVHASRSSFAGELGAVKRGEDEACFPVASDYAATHLASPGVKGVVLCRAIIGRITDSSKRCHETKISIDTTELVCFLA